jgi:serine/threonine protein phosphatase PrpC
MPAVASPLEVSIEVAQLSDPGRDPNKQVNEDSCGYAQTRHGHLCVLCDGMGGHYGGQEASRRAITTIFEQIEQAPEGATPGQALKHAIETAARRVYELGGPADNKVRPGSTVVAMLIHDGGLDVAHVGDSRAYVIRSGQIYPLTRDHSMVQAMIDAGFLSEDQAMGHPDANKITRALGMKPDVEVELRPDSMELFPGDLLLTASDGLTDLALAKDILGATRQALASGGLDHAAEQLVRMANDRGGHDNITVQLVKVTATGTRKTRSGSTQAGAPLTTTVSDGHEQRAHGGAPGYGDARLGRDAAPQAAAPQAHLAQAQEHVGPTSVDARHAPAGTFPMQPAATAHDGTSRSSHAAGLPQAHAGHASGGQQLPLPPMGGSVSPTLAQSLDGQGQAPGLAGYRLDNAGGLPLPPMSARFGAQAHASAHAQAPPAMASAPGFGGGQHGGWAPAPPSSYGGMAGPGQASGIDSASGRTGGSVLFLALAISFVVAVVALALLWLLVLR